MEKNINNSIQQDIIERYDVLMKSSIQLKKEFVGIDSIIDEIMEILSSWYLFPDFQEKPVVVNLWGLTGVGKTSLINRLAELINFSEKYYPIDLGGNNESHSVIRKKIEDIYEYDNGFPIIIGLDEFQYARTLDENQDEVENSYSRVIWELLDSGKFRTDRNFPHSYDLFELKSKLKYLLRNGIKVNKGKVTKGKENFIKILTQPGNIFFPDDELEKNNNFISDYYREQIYEGMKDLYDSYEDYNSHLNTLNGKQSIQFIDEVLSYASSEKTVDCSKSIIFIMGNLDEAYTMSQNFSPDMDADEFYEESLKINISTVKNALKKRFRNEQISRLGNSHIIYPAFNKDTFQKIIKMELNKIAKKYSVLLNSPIEFDSTIEKILYSEGVFPTQGTRPLFTTIHQIITSQFGKIFIHLIKENITYDKIVFSFSVKTVIVNFYNKKNIKDTIEFHPQLKLQILRKNTTDDKQAIVAVHEAGHAVLSCTLLKTIPEVIYSVLTDNNTGGMVFTKIDKDFVSKDELMNRAATYLGGYVAEMIVFGSEKITDGSESDIEKTTTFVNHMLKRAGFGSVPGAYHVKSVETWDQLHDIDNKKNDDAESLIKAGIKLATKVLTEEKVLLLKLADYLSDHQKLGKEEIENYVKKYAAKFIFDKTPNVSDYYRKCLKDQTQALQLEPPTQLNDNSVILLNKEI
ncbi:MAG: hypothetical protein KAI81_02370 [Candidatus Marinimicrobia bacterium]|nr:hypothetical protein [Candidatus Neomarinimicrobiota bacterium]